MVELRGRLRLPAKPGEIVGVVSAKEFNGGPTICYNSIVVDHDLLEIKLQSLEQEE